MKQRIQYIDLAKGLCILLVVLYHVFKHVHFMPEFVMTISCFRMPLYFFLSGLFFKEYENFIGFFLRKVNKLFIPFAFFYLVTSFAISNLLYYVFGFTVEGKSVLGLGGLIAFITKEKFANGPIWFLWVLFLVNIYFYILLNLVKKITSNKKIYPIILAVMCFLVGIIGSAVFSGRINLLAFLDSAMSALPFFAVGYLFNIFTDILVPNRWDKYLPIIIFVCFAITFYFGGNCSYRKNEFTINPFWQYICGIAGTLGIIFTAKIIQNIPFITYWGRYSIMILVSHSVLLEIVGPLILIMHLPLPLTVILIMIVLMFSYQLIIPLMKKYLPYVTAQKDVINVSKYVMPNHKESYKTSKME